MQSGSPAHMDSHVVSQPVPEPVPASAAVPLPAVPRAPVPGICAQAFVEIPPQTLPSLVAWRSDAAAAHVVTARGRKPRHVALKQSTVVAIKDHEVAVH